MDRNEYYKVSSGMISNCESNFDFLILDGILFIKFGLERDEHG